MKTIAMVLTAMVCVGCAAEAPPVSCDTGFPRFPRCESPPFNSWADIERLCNDGHDVWLPVCEDGSELVCVDAGPSCGSGDAPTCASACERL
jgi:hypothetical protein